MPRESVSRSTWALSFPAGAVDSDPGSSVFEKSGKVVHMSVPIESSTSFAASDAIATIPSGYRPKEAFYTVVFQTGTGTTLARINTDGTVKTNAALTSGKVVFIDTTWITQ